MVAGFGVRVARLAKTPTGARVAKLARTPSIDTISIVVRLSGRAGMAWIIAGFGAWVAGGAGGAARAMVVARLDRETRRVVAAEMAE
jgi:hypothetical protein